MLILSLLAGLIASMFAASVFASLKALREEDAEPRYRKMIF